MGRNYPAHGTDICPTFYGVFTLWDSWEGRIMVKTLKRMHQEFPTSQRGMHTVYKLRGFFCPSVLGERTTILMPSKQTVSRSREHLGGT